MAQEITINASIRASNGTFQFSQNVGQLQVDQANPGGGVPGTKTISTSETTIDLSALGTPGYAWMRNLDDENYITFGPQSSGAMVPFGKLKPGEICVFRLASGVTWVAKANTASCLVQIHVLED